MRGKSSICQRKIPEKDEEEKVSWERALHGYCKVFQNYCLPTDKYNFGEYANNFMKQSN